QKRIEWAEDVVFDGKKEEQVVVVQPAGGRSPRSPPLNELRDTREAQRRRLRAARSGSSATFDYVLGMDSQGPGASLMSPRSSSTTQMTDLPHSVADGYQLATRSIFDTRRDGHGTGTEEEKLILSSSTSGQRLHE
ncbi:unnamed protein product, partial [Amoebophrya sp. A25]